MKKNSLLVKYLNRPLKELIKSLVYPCLRKWLKNDPSFQDWSQKLVFKEKLPLRLSINTLRKLLFFPYYQKTTTDLSRRIECEPNIKLAIVIHAFYLDVFAEILSQLQFDDKQDIKLYVTTPPVNRKEVELVLQNFSLPYSIREHENRGRDILPFLLMLPEVIEDRRTLVLKLHTKGSNHLNRKNLWKDDLYTKLIGYSQINMCLNLFSKYPRLGMIAPEGHVLPMSLYYGSNALRVKRLLGIDKLTTANTFNLDFIAGSMFYARTKALEPLLELHLGEQDFEPESGQLDGTMAHAVERIFTWFLPHLGYFLADTNPHSYPIFRYKVTVNHKFTV